MRVNDYSNTKIVKKTNLFKNNFLKIVKREIKNKKKHQHNFISKEHDGKSNEHGSVMEIKYLQY